MASLRISSIARHLIVIAYRDHADLQSMPYEKFIRDARGRSLEGFRLITPKSLITVHTGGTKFAIGCRIHGGNDPFDGNTVLMHEGIGAGQPLLTDDSLTMPNGCLPDSIIVTLREKISAGERLSLGELIGVDEDIAGTPVKYIGRTSISVRFELDAVWLQWASCEANTTSQITVP